MKNNLKLSGKKRTRKNKSNQMIDTSNNRNTQSKKKIGKNSLKFKNNNFLKKKKVNDNLENSNEELQKYLLSEYNMEDYNNANISINQDLRVNKEDQKKALKELEKAHTHIFGHNNKNSKKKTKNSSKNVLIENRYEPKAKNIK